MSAAEANPTLRAAGLPPLPRNASEEEVAEALAAAAQLLDPQP